MWEHRCSHTTVHTNSWFLVLNRLQKFKAGMMLFSPLLDLFLTPLTVFSEASFPVCFQSNNGSCSFLMRLVVTLLDFNQLLQNSQKLKQLQQILHVIGGKAFNLLTGNNCCFMYPQIVKTYLQTEATLVPLINTYYMFQHFTDHIVSMTAQSSSHLLLNTSCVGASCSLQLSGSLSEWFNATTWLPRTTGQTDRSIIDLPAIP